MMERNFNVTISGKWHQATRYSVDLKANGLWNLLHIKTKDCWKPGFTLKTFHDILYHSGFLMNDPLKRSTNLYLRKQVLKMHKCNSNQLNITLFFMISIWIGKTFWKGINTICYIPDLWKQNSPRMRHWIASLTALSRLAMQDLCVNENMEPSVLSTKFITKVPSIHYCESN